jgi:antitoxin (DNA-binding transcriptional repressor) of toxin-antitoxin stability system
MKATVLDLRRNPGKILESIARNETVTLSHRGKPVARIEPLHGEEESMENQPAFGMWATRDDMSDPAAYVRRIRAGRFDAD